MTAVATVDRPTNEERIRAALWFAEHGFGIFSCWSTYATGMCRCPARRQCPSPGKHPIADHGFKEATQDAGRITTLLSAASFPNYGLVPPEGVFVLDVDGDGVERLVDLEALYGPLPPTLRTITAHGQHVFLRWPSEAPRPIGQMFGYVTRWGSGSNAGYVIGPRSVHESGFVYAPVKGALEIAELPGAWVQAVLEKPKDPDAFLTIEGEGYQIPDQGYDGSRYFAIRDYVASRYMRGITRDETWVGVRDVLAPRFAQPLTESDLESRFARAWHGTPERLGEPSVFNVVDAVPVEGIEIPLPSVWPEAPAEAAFHGVLGDIVRAVQDYTEADPMAIMGTLLAMVGVCVGKHRTIYQGSTQSANLFIVLVGDSSSGRKGTATSIGRDVMNAAYPEWERLIVAGLGSGEGLIGRLQRSEDGQEAEPRALVLESEFGRLLSVMGRDGSTLSPVVRDAWDGVPMGRFLAREQSLVLWHHVGILAHVTPVELHQKLSNADAANGFGNRFLWLAVRRTRLIPFPESPVQLVTQYVMPLRRAIEDAQAPGETTWAAPAAARWEWLYGAMAGTQRHGLSGSLTSRAEAQIVRIALLFSMLDRSVFIEEQHLVAAEALWAYAERSVNHVFGVSTGSRDADALLELLATEGPVDWEGAKKAIGIRHSTDLTTAYELLHGRGLADMTVMARTGGGRPRRVMHLAGANPANGAKPLGATQDQKKEEDT